jgi:hypothetical protein
MRRRKAWQKASGYNKRAKVEASIGRWKQVIGDGLRSPSQISIVSPTSAFSHCIRRSDARPMPRPLSIA